jgi:cytochrome c553
VRRGLALAAALGAAGVLAADPPPGRERAQQACATCHGPLGVSSAPDAPNLAGQPRGYLVAQLKAFRSGQRRHEVMNVVAKPLTDEQVGELADWYASLAV